MSICVKCHGIVLALYGVSSINLYALYKIQTACLISCGLSIQEFLDTFIYRSVSFLIRLVIPVLFNSICVQSSLSHVGRYRTVVPRLAALGDLSTCPFPQGRFGREIECQLKTGKLFQVFVINVIPQNNSLNLHQIYKFIFVYLIRLREPGKCHAHVGSLFYDHFIGNICRLINAK